MHSTAQHLYLCKHKHSNRERIVRPERRGVIIQLTISRTHWHCGPIVWIGVGFTARSSPICGWYTFISNNKLHIALFTLHHSGLSYTLCLHRTKRICNGICTNCCFLLSLGFAAGFPFYFGFGLTIIPSSSY